MILEELFSDQNVDMNRVDRVLVDDQGNVTEIVMARTRPPVEAPDVSRYGARGWQVLQILERVWDGQLTPEQAAETVFEQIDRMLDDLRAAAVAAIQVAAADGVAVEAEELLPFPGARLVPNREPDRG